MLLKRICWIFVLLLSVAASGWAAPTKEAGKELFIANCASCHNKNMKDKLTGPALGGVEDRWSAFPRKDLYSWVRNSQAMIATGHPRATELWATWKPTQMNTFASFSDENIESLLLYIDAAWKAAPVVSVDPKATTTGGEKDAGLPWMYIGLSVMLALLAFALMRIVNNLNNISRIQDGQEPIHKTTGEILTSKGTIAFAVFALILIFGYKTVDNATRMGREQNYQPDQPIAFSHKLHAGTNKIDCQYCHDSARRSKSSSIPGSNTCMNCHSAVKKGTSSGTAEITKIYAAIGFDPIAGKYIPDYDNKTDKEIEELYKKWIGQEYMADHTLTAID
ncbi:MAG: c-type cytochrome, partial [Saprospiraceae bacterium]